MYLGKMIVGSKYTEKDGRLYDRDGQDMGPAKARLDPDGTAIGETRVIQHLPGSNPDLVCRDGQFSLARFPEHEDRNGKRTALWKEGPLTIQERLNREDAPAYVIGLLEKQIEIYQKQANRLTGHDFDRNGIYLSALLKGKEALEKAFAVPSEDHDCMRDGCPIGQGCDRNG